ncbi:hypothetical protein PHLCEN_2v8194 [Hermanssonia centrifuga]|uniref:Peptidase A1 domain-containing protein n=1 Tax=Hermanssonia centrifuga TaxID=98765 RepID=A0A2R6NUD5_9APHY|nr:hypothetical protein PHLCEN_2v8194 [Hermanssonia centrifuga]
MAHWKLATFLAIAVAYASALEVRHVRSSRAAVSSGIELPVAPFSVPLTDKVPRSSAKKRMLRELRAGARSNVAVVAGAADDEEYLTDITIGGQDFKVVVDTGSSDTFLAGIGFQCFSLADVPVPEADCFFGTAGFDISKSETFVPFPDTNFNISFADAEFLTGSVGFDTITVGGLTVTQQEFGVVTAAAWNGDTISTGLMGLAFPTLTSVFNGTDPDADETAAHLLYNPFFFSAVQQKAVDAPFFSVALNRGTFAKEANSTLDPNLGFLAFGGIAPVAVTKTSTTVPVQGFATSSGASEIFFYAVDVEQVTFPGSTAKTTINAPSILDTGTTLNLVPTNIAKEFNARFKPPATFVEDEDTYFVDCNAIAPTFSIKIGGQEFAVDGRDQIVPSLDENNNLVCISGTQDGGPDEEGNFFVLGDVFLHNVVATFDISKNDITLTERASY